ncbi:MAG: hypothetical protein J6P44_08515 [Bacteroidales bacterium]|nr:hypothetical protein [Bacteroidales bacterium]
MNITKENIEAVLYDYAEGNLSLQEVKAVEKYLNLHSEYKEMLLEYDPMLKIPEENAYVFAEKEEVLRQTVGNKHADKVLIRRRIQRLSGVAAAALIIIAIGSIYMYQDSHNNASVTDTNNALTHISAAPSQNNSEKNPFFDAKKPFFLPKKTVFSDTDSARGKINTPQGENNQPEGNGITPSTYDNFTEEISQTQEYLAQTTLDTFENGETDPDNFAVMASNNDSYLQDDNQEVSVSDYEDFEYRIIFFNNKPTLWKRVKRWFSNAKEELFAGNKTEY